MSRCATLALILSVAACEHAQPVPANEPTMAPAPTPAPAPMSDTAVAPVEAPKVEPAPASRVAQPNAAAAQKKLGRKCNPMSRAACRWQDDTDEREQPRVIKKPAIEPKESSAP